MSTTPTLQHGKGTAETERRIRERIPFSVASLTARNHVTGSGRLNGAEYDRLRADFDTIDYVVYSYSTPVAWHTPAGWYMVQQRFSNTTSRTQSRIRAALRDETMAA